MNRYLLSMLSAILITGICSCGAGQPPALEESGLEQQDRISAAQAPPPGGDTDPENNPELPPPGSSRTQSVNSGWNALKLDLWVRMNSLSSNPTMEIGTEFDPIYMEFNSVYGPGLHLQSPIGEAGYASYRIGSLPAGDEILKLRIKGHENSGEIYVGVAEQHADGARWRWVGPLSLTGGYLEVPLPHMDNSTPDGRSQISIAVQDEEYADISNVDVLIG